MTMPDVDFMLAPVRQFLCIGLVSMTLAECAQVVLKGPIAVVPPRRSGERKVPHGLVAASLGGLEERGGFAVPRAFPVPERSAFGGRFGFPPTHLGQRDVPVAPKQPAPVDKARFDPHVADGAHAPDDVEGAVREVETSHVRNARFESVVDAHLRAQWQVGGGAAVALRMCERDYLTSSNLLILHCKEIFVAGESGESLQRQFRIAAGA